MEGKAKSAVPHLKAFQMTREKTKIQFSQLFADMSKHQKPKQPKPGSKPEQGLSVPTALVLNFIVVVALSLVLIFVNIPGVTNIVTSIAPCMSPTPRALGIVVILILFIHFVASCLPSAAKDAFGALGTLPKLLVTLLDPLQPSALSKPVLWSIALLVFSATAWGVYWSGGFTIPETTPIIESFSVRYPDGSTQAHRFGDKIQVSEGQLVRAEAVITNTVDVYCEWSTIKGILLPANGCATQYSVSPAKDVDSLTVHVQSQCRTQSAYASLHVVQP